MSERVTMPTEDWVAALDAAREKSGVTKKLLSGELAGVILRIPSGITPSGTKTITENGTYDVKSYASAKVDVPETEPVIKPLSVTANGTYTVPANADGYGPVMVNVPTEGDGITPSGTLDITANGDYDVTQYAGVSVDVPATGITPSGTLDITRNGTYDVTEYAAVDVDIPADGGGSSGDGLVSVSGETTALPISTGLASIRYLMMHRVGNTKGLVSAIYDASDGSMRIVYCTSSSQYSQIFTSAKLTDPDVSTDGGTFAWEPSTTNEGLNGTYTWIAVGKA